MSEPQPRFVRPKLLDKSGQVDPDVVDLYTQDRLPDDIESGRVKLEPIVHSKDVEFLRNRRIAWHDRVATMFSKDDVASVSAIEAAIGQFINLGDRSYQIEDYLGAGGYGIVFTARDQAKQLCVMKVSNRYDRREMFFQAGADSDSEAHKDALRARSVIMETNILKRLNALGEKNPAPKLLAGQLMKDPRDHEQRIAVIAMEYIPGRQLDAIDPTTIQDRIAVAQGLIDDLILIHSKGVIHGDVKSANIILQPDGKPKFIDFGSGSIPELSEKQKDNNPTWIEKDPQPAIYAQPTQAIFRSKEYVIMGENASIERDNYSLGRVIQRLVFGEVDFKDPDRMIERLPTLSAPMRELARIATMLVRDEPTDRASLETVRELFKQWETEEEIFDIE